MTGKPRDPNRRELHQLFFSNPFSFVLDDSMHSRRLSLLTVTGMLTVLLTGCTAEQEKRFPVAGKVFIDGQPVSTGAIQFVPEEGRPFASKIGEDGSFRLAELSVSDKGKLPGVKPGKYRIGISSKHVVDEHEGEVHKHIPGKYADFRTSELAVEITDAKEDMVIDLTWEDAEETNEANDEANDEAAAEETAESDATTSSDAEEDSTADTEVEEKE
jgi:hypothetical protein